MVEDEGSVSPMGHYFNCSVLSLTILVVFETEVPIDDSSAVLRLEKEFLPINPRFSSIMVADNKGRPRWKKVSLKLEDHVKVPTFAGDSVESYDEQLQDYLSKIAMEQLPQSRPLWEFHLIKYPTRGGGAGAGVIKLHHALGDGFSLMGALLSSARRRDDSSLPLTFPSPRTRRESGCGLVRVLGRLPRGLRLLFNTGGDFSRLLLNRLLEDDRTPLRSGEPGVEFRPVEISSATFSLNELRDIKAKLKATVNDVVAGIVFYGIHLYLHQQHESGQYCTKDPRMTAIVLANTRATKTYRTVEEMAIKGKNGKASWGNQLGMVFVSIPKCDDVTKADPAEFVFTARKIIEKKKNSLGLHLTEALLQAISKIKGPETAAKYIHASITSTTLSISNLIGPNEQMIVADHPVKSFYFISTGVPQSLHFSVVSYAGNLRIATVAEKGFINSQLLMTCIEKAFRKISDATFVKAP